jgi:hypothetical protein
MSESREQLNEKGSGVTAAAVGIGQAGAVPKRIAPETRVQHSK